MFSIMAQNPRRGWQNFEKKKLARRKASNFPSSNVLLAIKSLIVLLELQLLGSKLQVHWAICATKVIIEHFSNGCVQWTLFMASPGKVGYFWFVNAYHLFQHPVHFLSFHNPLPSGQRLSEGSTPSIITIQGDYIITLFWNQKGFSCLEYLCMNNR